MKKTHIILLVLVAAAIGFLISYVKTAATYETIAGAVANPGKFVHVAAQLDTTAVMEYDELKDPNYLSFTAIDSTGSKMKVVYRKGKIENLEISERVVLEGRYITEQQYFDCKRVQTKCPSKYKNESNPVKTSQTVQHRLTEKNTEI